MAGQFENRTRYAMDTKSYIYLHQNSLWS